MSNKRSTMSNTMSKEWIDKTKAQFLTGMANITIRRWVDKHKHDNNCIKKTKGKIYINSQELEKTYPFKNNDQQKINNEQHHDQEKQRANLILEKQNKDIITENQQIINKLLIQKEQKSYLPFYIALIFTLFIIILGYLGFCYRNELLKNFDNELKVSNNTIKKLTFELKKHEQQQAYNELEFRKVQNQLINAISDSHAVKEQRLKREYELKKSKIEIENLKLQINVLKAQAASSLPKTVEKNTAILEKK